ncbi:CBS domain-containing protein [Paramaledivibacter caminithermalis]|jgi:CBS domain-containing protein|uniref:CBS domain-containing protein n=1 Tax=Paramaledivibacter caminithermalis (strain DSM 15212 / CIP 107654 / DViRD3) TaxID=1121301 RepID=A0A1M6KRY7_PARC5|nr:CBS domain-containing protein [Paramaledivibacter caminithermalis]SHJ61709.1 CBS domain-containing protein [Paramaledivibacter caminithermalis DSM 15212]
MKARDIMNRDVISVKAEDNVEYIVQILLNNKISGVPVTDEEDKVVGIVSESDLIYPEKSLHLPAFIPILDGIIFLESFKKLEKEIKKMTAYQVKDVMVKDVITVKEDTEVQEIVNILLDKKINRVPVVNEEDKLVGIITRSNILRHIY